MLGLPCSPPSLKSVLGGTVGTENVVGVLSYLAEMKMSPRACAEWLRAADAAAARAPRPDIVWSGPEVSGVHARNTRRVYEELLGTAERSVWASTYAYFDGAKAFDVLARRMDARSDLRVTLLLNIQRRRGDTSVGSDVVRRFADRFWGMDWPGTTRPAVYYDPRSLESGGPAGVLHAKAVLADDESLFITSANLTEAAFDRNIELGFLVRDPALAASVTAQFRALIDRYLLQLLPAHYRLVRRARALRRCTAQVADRTGDPH